MNGLIENVAQFWEQLLIGGATFMRNQQDKIDQNNFDPKDFLQGAAQLWLDNATNFFRLAGASSGMGGATVVLLLPGGSTQSVSDQILVPPTIGLGTITTSGFKAVQGNGTADLTATLTGFDQLNVT